MVLRLSIGLNRMSSDHRKPTYLPKSIDSTTMISKISGKIISAEANRLFDNKR